jgi:predicted nucleotidyltransferase component of viral defense system
MSLHALLTSQAERQAVFTHAAGLAGVVPFALEKDFWVCWTLKSLAELQGTASLTFKGGTSLSKVHKLIRRFSEDIDLTFSRKRPGRFAYLQATANP